MYLVDQNKLREVLSFFEQFIDRGQLIQSVIHRPMDEQERFLTLLACERYLHICFQLFTDIASIVIDGFIMRDPGSYEDMVNILADEQAINKEMADLIKELVAYYRITSKDYRNVNEQLVLDTFKRIYPDIRTFSDQMRDFIQKELRQ
jgi:uncharacterized protein YutE (UPF0331/DUF86 family)